jgi:hypothetical protein
MCVQARERKLVVSILYGTGAHTDTLKYKHIYIHAYTHMHAQEREQKLMVSLLYDMGMELHRTKMYQVCVHTLREYMHVWTWAWSYTEHKCIRHV